MVPLWLLFAPNSSNTSEASLTYIFILSNHLSFLTFAFTFLSIFRQFQSTVISTWTRHSRQITFSHNEGMVWCISRWWRADALLLFKSNASHWRCVHYRRHCAVRHTLHCIFSHLPWSAKTGEKWAWLRWTTSIIVIIISCNVIFPI